MGEAVTDGSDVSRAAAAYLAAAWLLTAAVHAYVIMPASVLPQVAAGLAVPESTAVWLISAVLLAWAVTNIAVGTLIDRVGDRPVVAVGGAVTVVGAAAGWVAAVEGLFAVLIATRVVAGAAIGAAWIASTTLVGRLFDTERRGTALGVFTTSAPAGFAVGQVIGPPIATGAGWPAVFAAGASLSLAALVAFVGVWIAVAADRGTADEQSAGDGPAVDASSAGRNVAVALRNRTVLVGGAVAFVAYSLYLFLNSWLPTYLVREFALSLDASGLLAAVFPAMGIASRTGGGVLSDRLFGHRRLPVLKWSLVVTAPVLAAIAISRSVAVLVGLLIVGGFVVQLTFGVVYSYVQEAVDAEREGTALSILGSAGMLGAFSAPVLAGELIDLTGGYTAAFGYAVALAAVGLVLVFGVAEP